MNWLEKTIAAVSPRTAYRRAAYREGLRMFGGAGGYAAAAKGRHLGDWRASTASPDTLLGGDLITLRSRSKQMIRDNPYAAAALENLTAQLVGDGIEYTALHADPKVADLATNIVRERLARPLDGRNDGYGVQALSVRTMLGGGEALHLWGASKKEPNATVEVLEGDFLDHTRTQRTSETLRTVLGVEFQEKRRTAYWLFDDHPGDGLTGSYGASKRVDAEHVDHIFRPLWPGQVRGQPWLTPGMTAARHNDDLEEALRIKRKVEACLVVFEQIGNDDEGETGGIGEQSTNSRGLVEERMSPGMIYRGRPGSSITAVNPSTNGGADAQHRQQLMAICAAWGVPYYMVTGDVTSANYTSLRADKIKFEALLDAILAHAVFPFVCDPMPRRWLQVEALKRNEPRLLEVLHQHTPAPRVVVDPLKDRAAEIMEIRAGLESMPNALAARGINWRDHYRLYAEVNKFNDALGLAFDTDPRRLNGAGSIQAPAGFVMPKGGDDRARLASFMERMAVALVSGDTTMLQRGGLEVAAAYRDQDPLAGALEQILVTLTED